MSDENDLDDVEETKTKRPRGNERTKKNRKVAKPKPNNKNKHKYKGLILAVLKGLGVILATTGGITAYEDIRDIVKNDVGKAVLRTVIKDAEGHLEDGQIVQMQKGDFAICNAFDLKNAFFEETTLGRPIGKIKNRIKSPENEGEIVVQWYNQEKGCLTTVYTEKDNLSDSGIFDKSDINGIGVYSNATGEVVSVYDSNEYANSIGVLNPGEMVLTDGVIDDYTNRYL